MTVLALERSPVQGAKTGRYGLPLGGSLSTDFGDHAPSCLATAALREALDASKAKTLDEILPEVFIPVQEWEGYIVEIATDDFVGRLLDITAGDKSEKEEAVIPLGQLSEEDATNVALGRVFRLVIGHRIAKDGKKTDVVRVVFRDLPRITAEDLEEGRKWADEVIRAFET